MSFKELFVAAWMVACFALMSICTMSGCASPLERISPRYYKPRLAAWNGALLGETPEDDLDAAQTCAPTMKTDGKCVVMIAEDFFEFKQQCVNSISADTNAPVLLQDVMKPKLKP
jgi:hypothetical protein